MKFAALGRTQWLYEGIISAEKRGHQCVLIATAPASPEYKIKEADFVALAEKLGCPCVNDTKLDSQGNLAAFEQSKAEVAISVNWPTLINTEVRSKFQMGVLNAHCGDLPKYRGNACPNWAILNGEHEIVVSIHEMIDELDAGPILLQDRMPLTESTYIGQVYEWLNTAIPSLWVKALDGLQSGTVSLRPQPNEPMLSLRCFPRMPQDALIDWKQPADEIVKLIRASAEPFQGAFTYLHGQKLTIWRGHAENLRFPHCGIPGQVVEVRKSSGEVAILADKGIVVLEEVEMGTRGRIGAGDAIRSTRLRLGLHHVQVIDRLAELEKKLMSLDQSKLQ